MKETLQQILEAMMTISVRGNDVITMSNCLQALNGIVQNMSAESATKNVVEPEMVD